MGKGMWLSGMSWSSMKKHSPIIPLYAFGIAGAALASFYTWRLAVKSPEVTWNRKTNPEPWNEYENKQYKFLSTGRDYTVASPAPKYK